MGADRALDWLKQAENDLLWAEEAVGIAELILSNVRDTFNE